MPVQHDSVRLWARLIQNAEVPKLPGSALCMSRAAIMLYDLDVDVEFVQTPLSIYLYK